MGRITDADFSRGENISGLLKFLQEEEPDFSLVRGVTWIDALNLAELREPPRGELLIAQIDSISALQQAKEILASLYPPDHPISVIEYNEEGVLRKPVRIFLGEADKSAASRLPVCLRILPRQYYYIGDMVNLMKSLRDPGGCPWDREQDHLTLRPYLLEETYEVIEAINSGVPEDLCEELGDLLLQILFHSQLAAEKGEFYLWQVIDGISRKIYRRHPHVFQNEKAENARDVSQIWQQVKNREKEGKKNDLFALPAGLPALLRSQKLQKKAATVGFDWPDRSGAVRKVFEELGEFVASMADGSKEEIADELGDLFFTLVNLARFLDLDAESVLHGTSEKFLRRFRHIDEQVKLRGGDYTKFTLQELDDWWNEAKKKDRDQGSGIRD